MIAVFLRNSYKRYGCDLFYTIDLKVFRTDWILREQLVPSLTYLAYTNVTNTAISAARGSTVPLKMSQSFKNFKTVKLSPPPIPGRFSKKLADATLRLINSGGVAT